ncbi:hypothetical protein PCANC_03160 [Puccinia coronata f. sp. avenae]|uniref:OPT family small oligopeptide transporter n=1 Tax=Puccinia coronata f. sp. avenae TaxID=200324 RepID=A0A2N5T854_9BASI|nr:hypothetical protein PCANC_03160 [Puccinia coronata f. sp. avenae]
MDNVLKKSGLQHVELKLLQFVRNLSAITGGGRSIKTKKGSKTIKTTESVSNSGNKQEEEVGAEDTATCASSIPDEKRAQSDSHRHRDSVSEYALKPTEKRSEDSEEKEEQHTSADYSAQEELSLIPLTDDADSPVFTLRSLLVGCLVAVLGAAVTQLFVFKPVHMRLQPAFLQITAMLLGRACAWKSGPQWWNPGPFSMKETVFSSLIATSASVGAYAIELLAVQELFFDEAVSFGMSFGILISSQLIGYGWAGLLQPILVYPSEVFYPDILPSVSLFYSLCGDGPVAKDQIKFFKRAFVAMGIYEIFPGYIAPSFQAISVFCLSLPKNQIVTNIFGGAQPFEGLGFLNLSGDWALVGSHGPLYTPLNAQVHHIVGVLLSLFILSFVYTNSWYDAGVTQNFPFMSVSLLTSNGTTYPIKRVIDEKGSPNEDVIQEIGIPFFTSTYVVVQIIASLAVTSAISHVLLENYKILFGSLFKKSGAADDSKVDPHRALCQKCSDFPKWGFGLILICSIGLAMGLSSLSQSGLPPVGLLFAIFLSSILTLAVSFLNGITGFHLHVSGVVQMFGGLLFPGNAFGNMWFTTFGASTVNQSVNMLKDLKLGQYMHIPPTLVVLAQMIGTVVGIFVNYAVMKTIVSSQREILLSSGGDGVFSGVAIATFQSSAVSWGAFAQRMFLANEKYGAIPLALVVGLFLPIPFFILHRFFPAYKFNLINVPLVAGSIASGYSVATAGRLVNIIIGLLSQFWARRYKPRWFLKYNYVLSAALDGGAQIMILFLSMVFQGGDGKKVPFPTYFLNPKSSIPKDYCYMPPKGSTGSE